MDADGIPLTSLEGSILPLQSSFNEATGKPRFLALVSPTCGPCLQGATAVREDVIGEFREAGFPVSLIWIPMLSGDSSAAIEQTAAEFRRDGMQRFADPDRTVGKLVADSLGGFKTVAWDIYLFYSPDGKWTDELPEPTEWLHQLGGYSWATPERYRCSNELTDELAILARQMVSRYGD